jgi:hypothetical protein
MAAAVETRSADVAHADALATSVVKSVDGRVDAVASADLADADANAVAGLVLRAPASTGAAAAGGLAHVPPETVCEMARLLRTELCTESRTEKAPRSADGFFNHIHASLAPAPAPTPTRLPGAPPGAPPGAQAGAPPGAQARAPSGAQAGAPPGAEARG